MIEVKIIKKADDVSLGQKTLRVSLGGSPSFGYYVTYRGDIKECIVLIEDCLRSLKAVEIEPEVSPDYGKKFA